MKYNVCYVYIQWLKQRYKVKNRDNYDKKMIFFKPFISLVFFQEDLATGRHNRNIFWKILSFCTKHDCAFLAKEKFQLDHASSLSNSCENDHVTRWTFIMNHMRYRRWIIWKWPREQLDYLSNNCSKTLLNLTSQS